MTPSQGTHFGRPGQPYNAEALDWLKSQIDGKTVYCQLIRKDQYARIVALAYVPYPFVPALLSKGKCISLEMLKAGWAVTYEQIGAEYGPYSKEEFMAIQEEARLVSRSLSVASHLTPPFTQSSTSWHLAERWLAAGESSGVQETLCFRSVWGSPRARDTGR